MNVKLFRVILPVTDIERASAYYAAILGMPGRRVSEGRHYFDCGGTFLACYDAGADGDDDVKFRPNPEWIYFAVDNVEVSYDACKRAGVTFAPFEIHDAPAGQVVQRPWGERSFYVIDPFGNKIGFVQRDTMFTGA